MTDRDQLLSRLDRLSVDHPQHACYAALKLILTELQAQSAMIASFLEGVAKGRAEKKGQIQ